MKITATMQGGFSPQLMRAVSILRMSAASLAQFLAQQNNPCLRATAAPPPPDADADIRQILRAECMQTPLPPGQRPLLDWLIECVGDDGFLELPDDDLPLPAADISAAVHTLQQLAPPGVAARSASERLLLLLAQTPANDIRARAETLVRDHWQWLCRKRWDKLPKRGLMPALALLESLPPAQLPSPAAAPALPDVVFTRRRGLWRAQAGAGATLTAAARKTAGATLAEWRDAREITAAVAARRRWVLAAAQHAADHQSAFFEDGAAALRPLPMQTAAATLAISPAMLSHIVSGKRAIFAGGEFPLKYLYGSHIGSTVIQHKIQQMISSEDPRRPHSDEALRRLLRRQGLTLARRTVAKHRRLSGAAAAALRKRAVP